MSSQVLRFDEDLQASDPCTKLAHICTNIKEDVMSDLIRSSEFGDWLLEEISNTRRQSKSAQPDQVRPASARLESLKVSKQVLLEFLTIQQAMLDAAHAAREARRQRVPRRPRDRPHLGLVQREVRVA